MNKILQKKLQELDYLGSTLSLLNWDSSVEMPKKGVKYRSEAVAYLSNERKIKITDPEFLKLIDELAQEGTPSDEEKAIVRRVEWDREYLQCLPEEFYIQFQKDIAQAESAWEEARHKNDFKIFAPALQKIIEGNKKRAEYIGVTTTPYDIFLNEYERGLTTDVLDPIFEKLKKECIEILQKTKESSNAPKKLPKGMYPQSLQKKMSLDLFKIIGFSMGSGHLSESTHPFTSSSTPDDVRLTVNYNEKDFTDAYLSGLHEAGHGLYEQNIKTSLYGTTLCQGTAMSIHESSSRMYENNIGKSKDFLTFYYPQLQKLYPELSSFSLDDFYRTLNTCGASFIRIHADEVSYGIHIIIRYEMEKLMINEDIPVEELPKIWNQKYQDYLGITPPSDLVGILQDIHWANASVGYFPSYSLGSMYACQLFSVYQKQNPQWQRDIQSGNTLSLTEWMTKEVYQYGSIYTPTELITKISGKTLNVDHYINYLKTKFYDIYGIS